MGTTWCARNLSSVLDDIAAYSFWGEYHDSLAIDGIFVDETPTHYSPESVSYLQTIEQAVHESDGLKEGFIGKMFLSFRHCRRIGPHSSCTIQIPAIALLVVPLVKPLIVWSTKPRILRLVYCKPAILLVQD